MATSRADGADGADGDRLDDDTLLRAVERFALLLTEGGMPRMAARVFAFLVIAPVDGHTASGLSAELRVSPAAVSGAVRYLVQTGLLVREREPGARSDTYHLHDDLWYETYLQRLDLLQRWDDLMADTIERLGPANVGHSLRETHAFLGFILGEFPEMLKRWQLAKDRLVAGDDG